MSITGSQAAMLENWVTAGGNLIAMRPDQQLYSLLGLTAAGWNAVEPVSARRRRVAAPGAGIGPSPALSAADRTMQFHGTADLTTLNAGTTLVAQLYSDTTTATARHPAVTLKNVGTSGGQAVAFYATWLDRSS
jgi:hypothetical protein